MDANIIPNPASSSAIRSAMEKLQSIYQEQISRGSSSLEHINEEARQAMIATARDLITSLETPLESILWVSWAEPTRFAATRIAIDLALFEHLSADEATPKTKDQLASKAGADPNLIGRVLSHLASTHVIEEVAADTYKATSLSAALTIPKYRDTVVFCSSAALPIFQTLPLFLQKTAYKEPLDNTASPFQFAHATPLKSWAWRKERPHVQKAFNNHMAGYHQGRPSWMDVGFYPVQERIVEGMLVVGDDRGDGVAIVDVGGGMGHDLVELKRKCPELRGRFILQDLGQVIEQIPLPLEGIETSIHDFYTEQPVKGARIYHLHSVLHDWPDADCHRILHHIVTAMKAGYSKLLINENVVPDVGASWQITALDWFMMGFAASRERTEGQWRELLRGAGLRVTGIWTKDVRFESLIEAVLMEG